VQAEGLLTALGGAKGKSKDKTWSISETTGYNEKHEIIKSKTKKKI
jgi:hypothetical protein